jgi:plastocyanin
VTIQNFSFMPRTIVIKAGTNSIKATASITGMLSSGQLSKGQILSFTYQKKGTFCHECTIHAAVASMHGKVIVK